jgi:hypothetical protein
MNDIQRLRAKRSVPKTNLSETTYYAACESGHEYWNGPDRDTYDKAKEMPRSTMTTLIQASKPQLYWTPKAPSSVAES